MILITQRCKAFAKKSISQPKVVTLPLGFCPIHSSSVKLWVCWQEESSLMAWEAFIILHSTVYHFSQQIEDWPYPALGIHLFVVLQVFYFICSPFCPCTTLMILPYLICSYLLGLFLLFLVFFNYSWIGESHVTLKAWELTLQGDKEKLDPWDQGGYHETRIWTEVKLHLTLALKQKYPRVDPSLPTDVNLFLKGSTEPTLLGVPRWSTPHCTHNWNFLLVSFMQRKPMPPFHWLEQLITICFTFLFYMYEDFPSAVFLRSSCLFSKDVVENIDVLLLVALKKIIICNMELPLGWGRGGGDASVKYLGFVYLFVSEDPHRKKKLIFELEFYILLVRLVYFW